MTRLGLVLANVAWLLAAPVPPSRAQETSPSVIIVPTVDSRPPADSALASAQTDIGATLDGAPEAHNWSTAGEDTTQQPSATSQRVPADVDFLRSHTWKRLYSD